MKDNPRLAFNVLTHVVVSGIDDARLKFRFLSFLTKANEVRFALLYVQQLTYFLVQHNLRLLQLKVTREVVRQHEFSQLTQEWILGRLNQLPQLFVVFALL